MVLSLEKVIFEISGAISSELTEGCKLCVVQTILRLSGYDDGQTISDPLINVVKTVSEPAPKSKLPKPCKDPPRQKTKHEVPGIAADFIEYIEAHEIDLSTVASHIGIAKPYLRDMLTGSKKLSASAEEKINVWLQSRERKVPAVERTEFKRLGIGSDKIDLLAKLTEHRRVARIPMHQISKECGFKDPSILLTILEGKAPPNNKIDYGKIESYLRKVGAI